MNNTIMVHSKGNNSRGVASSGTPFFKAMELSPEQQSIRENLLQQNQIIYNLTREIY